jgi:hypothetical protein
MLNDEPCEYIGDPMEIVHRDFNITEAQFNAAVEDLQEAVAYLNLPGSPQNRLLARLAPCARRSFIVKIGRFRSWPTNNLMTTLMLAQVGGKSLLGAKPAEFMNRVYDIAVGEP